jgi:hypothetical protein
MQHILVFDRSFFVLLALQAPLLAELARRFINPSSFFLLTSDVFIFLIFILIARKTLVRYWGYQIVILLALMCFSILSAIVNDLPASLIYVGTRPFVMGFISAVLGYYFIESGRGIYRLIWVVTFWSALITGYAILQIVLGIDHPINILPEGTGDAGQGIGYHSETGASMFGLFRPTSIFFHTGKFGQVAFFMALIPALFFLSKSRDYSLFLRLLTVLGFVAVFASGQRAAFVFVIITLAVYLLRMGRISSVVRAVAIGLAILAIPVWLGGSDLVANIGERYAQLDKATTGRLVNNSSVFFDVLDDSGILGQGVGMYSFGAGSFAVKMDFVTEHSWIRLLAEWGVLGLLVVLFFLLSVLFSCTMRSRYRMKEFSSDILRFASISIALSLAMWSFTHDVIGNTLTMQIAFTVFGVTRGWIVYQHHKALAENRLRTVV